MLEGVVLNSGAYDWNVSLDSSNMMDGITDMTFIAFDAAGNSTEPAVYNMKISNNAPRLAGVTFGADRNMNGEYDTDEIETEFVDTYKNQPLKKMIDTMVRISKETGLPHGHLMVQETLQKSGLLLREKCL